MHDGTFLRWILLGQWTGRSEEKAKGDAAKQWSKQSQDKPKDLLMTSDGS